MKSYSSDLKERCYRFGLEIIILVDNLPKKRSAWVISDQLIRSATSIGANIIEAKASSSRLEFKRFYEIALRSANESEYWLKLLIDSRLMTKEKVKPLLIELAELIKMLASSVIKLKKGKA